MTTFVVPCGRSVHDGLAKIARAGALVDAINGWSPAAAGLADDAVMASWVAEMGDAAEDARLPDLAPEPLSAETHTLAAATGVGRLSRLASEGHRVVLLASDTPDGITAALAVAHHLAGTDTDRIGYVSTPTDDRLRLLPTGRLTHPVTVARVRGLNATSDGLRQATGGIGRLLRAALDLGDPVDVHLSGGYKATLLHTLAMTEMLHSLAPQRVSAQYIFEGGSSGLVPIGLRRFPDEYCQDMRSELRQVRDTGRPPVHEPTLGGVGWCPGAGGRVELTDFGRGYLAVLGEPLTAMAHDASS